MGRPPAHPRCPVYGCCRRLDECSGRPRPLPPHFSLVLDSSIDTAVHNRVCQGCYARHTGAIVPLDGRVRVTPPPDALLTLLDAAQPPSSPPSPPPSPSLPPPPPPPSNPPPSPPPTHPPPPTPPSSTPSSTPHPPRLLRHTCTTCTNNHTCAGPPTWSSPSVRFSSSSTSAKSPSCSCSTFPNPARHTNYLPHPTSIAADAASLVPSFCSNLVSICRPQPQHKVHESDASSSDALMLHPLWHPATIMRHPTAPPVALCTIHVAHLWHPATSGAALWWHLCGILPRFCGIYEQALPSPALFRSP